MASHELTVLIANDHTIVRDGLKKTVEENPGFRVVAETGSFSEIPKLLKKQPVDILMIDDHMPGGNLLDCLKKVKKEWPAIVVILVSFIHKEIDELVEEKPYLNGFIRLQKFPQEAKAILSAMNWQG